MEHGTRRGFIQALILIVVALIVLGYFGFRLDDILGREAVQHNLATAWDFVKTVWHDYLARPFAWIWNKVVIGLIWENIRSIAELTKTTPPTPQ